MTATQRSDRDLWDTLSAEVGRVADTASHARATYDAIDQARDAVARRRDPGRVDLYVDPACEYTWLTYRWLAEVRRRRRLDVVVRMMSLELLNVGRDLAPGYRAQIDRSRLPSRVGAAIAVEHGHAALAAWYAAFGAQLFRGFAFPTAEQYDEAVRHALESTGLPATLADVGDRYDGALRRSHAEGVTPAGLDVGTPVLHLAGAAFYGPVLGGVPRGADAVRLFEALEQVAAEPHFYELKRTRTAPPDPS